MDIASLSTSLSSMRAISSVNVSLLRKAMDITQENANMLIENIKEMELSVNPNLGSNVDIKI